MKEITPWTKRIIILGIIGISITAMALDFTGGKELAMIGIAGLLGMIRMD